MINIKRYIDRVSQIDGRQGKDVVIPIAEARALRDEITKLLADLYTKSQEKPSSDSVINVEISGGKW